MILAPPDLYGGFADTGSRAGLDVLWEASDGQTVSFPPQSCPRALGWRPGRQRENQGRGLGVPRPPRVQPHGTPPCDHQEPGQDARRASHRGEAVKKLWGISPLQPPALPQGSLAPLGPPGKEARPQGGSLAEKVETPSKSEVGGF